jgi:succinate dehydrogenase / fumarate reductase cytochrome b subunit
MSWVKAAMRSSLGGKYLVAVTGLLLVLFLVAHLAGNLLLFQGPSAMNQYAQQLRSLGPLLWVARIGLLVIALSHVVLALKLNLANKSARPVPYARKIYLNATLASRTMLPTGLCLLLFIFFHLADFTLRLTRNEYQTIDASNVYETVVAGFSNPIHSTFYILMMIVLGMHLNHGITSLFQTLGVNHPKYNPIFKWSGPVLGTLLALGFSSLPLSVLLGLVR